MGGEARAIFISYRRSDARGDVRAIYNRLVTEFGADQVFLDAGAIGPGQDFEDLINHALEGARAFLVVIGPSWLQELNARAQEKQGGAAVDYVRQEIAHALANPELNVIPVLMGGVAFPGADALPADLRGLARRNAVRINDSSQRAWESSVDELIDGIRREGVPGRRWRYARNSLLVLGTVAALAYFWRPWNTRVPEVTGLLAPAALQALQSAGLRPQVHHHAISGSDSRAYDLVTEVVPEPGTTVRRGSAVNVTVLIWQPYPLICRGGEALKVHREAGTPDGLPIHIAYQRGPGAISNDVAPGQCAWQDRAVHLDEPVQLFLNDGRFLPNIQSLADPGTLTVFCVFNNRKNEMVVVGVEPYLEFKGVWLPRSGLCKSVED